MLCHSLQRTDIIGALYFGTLITIVTALTFFGQSDHITLDPLRLSRRNFSWSSHYSNSLSGDLMVFPAGGATTIGCLSMLIRGITITLTGVWHSGQLAALSPHIMLRNSLLTEGKIQHISVLGIWCLTKIIFSS